MAPDAPSQAAGEAPDMAAVLCQLAETYGRGICREPQRVAAMLKDLCPDRRRESFLLVAALKEHVVSEVVGSLDSIPESVLVARSVRKLRDNLGLAEDSARWTVDSWFPACRILSTAPDVPLRFAESEDDRPIEAAPERTAARSRPVDFAWLGWCGLTVACSAIALATVGRVAFYHAWSSFYGWSVETAILAAGLGIAGGGLALAAGRLRDRTAPNHRVLDPNRAAFAMLLEVVVLLSLPLVPIGSGALWAAEWIGELHVTTQTHDLTFHLGRLLQTLVLAGFVYGWTRSMVVVQGRIASSLVRRR